MNIDTIVAPATANGLGAIAVIRLSGRDAVRIGSFAFRGKNLSEVPSHTVHFGTLRDTDNTIIDEVLVSVFRAPKSYTREDVLEFSCHGSPYIVQKILALFVQHGARMATPGEFTMRAFLNGQLDLAQAEAVADLIAAESEQAHRVAMQQMRGGFSAQIKTLRNQLIHFASMIELELDFGEEDVVFADRTALNTLISEIISVLKALLQSFQLGNVLKNGVATAIIGRPNAGKSTLLNALLNDDRAIVSPVAGTTRDTIEELFTLNGIRFRLIDTAGIRSTEDEIEAIGVQKAYQKAQQAHLILYVFDAAQTTYAEVATDVQSLTRAGVSLILCGNKMDLLNETQQADWHDQLQPIRQKSDLLFIGIAAKNNTNLDALTNALTDTIQQRGHAETDTIVSNARHAAAISAALESLRAAHENLHAGISSDWIAIDIRRSIHELGLVVGAVSTDDLLEKIFRDFCIGK